MADSTICFDFLNTIRIKPLQFIGEWNEYIQFANEFFFFKWNEKALDPNGFHMRSAIIMTPSLRRRFWRRKLEGKKNCIINVNVNVNVENKTTDDS